MESMVDMEEALDIYGNPPLPAFPGGGGATKNPKIRKS